MARKNKNDAISSAKSGVLSLFAKARTVFHQDRKKANDYVRKARRAAMKVRMRLPLELKRSFCKHCYSFLMPGVNSRVRVHKSKVIIYCSECRKFTRIPLIPKKSLHGFLEKKLSMKQILSGLRDKEDRKL